MRALCLPFLLLTLLIAGVHIAQGTQGHAADVPMAANETAETLRLRRAVQTREEFLRLSLSADLSPR